MAGEAISSHQPVEERLTRSVCSSLISFPLPPGEADNLSAALQDLEATARAVADALVTEEEKDKKKAVDVAG